MRFGEIILFAHVVTSACPDEKWIHRPDSTYCYRVFENVGASWNQAQSECIKYGADLVSYESATEMTWVYNQLNWNQNSGSWRYYWNGLNDLHQVGQLKWVTSYPDEEIPYKYNNFNDKIADMDPSRRCTYSLFSNNLPQDYGHEGKWYKEKCEKNKYFDFVCKIDEKNVKKKCPSDFELVKFGYNGETCLRYKSSAQPWIEAFRKCKDDLDSTLIHISNDQEQKDFTTWLETQVKKDKDAGVWLGMTDMESDPENPQMEWFHQGVPTYTNWIFGQPETAESQYPLNTCAYIEKGMAGELGPNWSADACRPKKQYVCQKSLNSQCPDGWFLAPNEENGKCIQFYVSGSSHKAGSLFSS